MKKRILYLYRHAAYAFFTAAGSTRKLRLQSRGFCTTQTQVIETGLKYVNNDICYPALLVIGQLINALESGKYDLEHTALIITQTRWRLPCLQLYLSAAQGFGKSRTYPYSCYQPQCQWFGAAARLPSGCIHGA